MSAIFSAYLAKSSQYIIQVVMVSHAADLHEAVQTLVGHELVHQVFIWLQDLLEGEESSPELATLGGEQPLWRYNSFVSTWRCSILDLNIWGELPDSRSGQVLKKVICT